MSLKQVQYLMLFLRLNPYYTGSYSMRVLSVLNSYKSDKVLILIILEVTL